MCLCPLQENDLNGRSAEGETTGFLSRKGCPLWVLELGRAQADGLSPSLGRAW